MALRSHYKGEWIGKNPMCAICAGKGVGPRARHHLTHGVTVWLCEGHRSEEFQRRRAGRDFVESLAAVWRAAGIDSARHAAALRAHLKRIRRDPAVRHRPGSYAWPAIRDEAERRWRSGEPPRDVIADLRRRCATRHTNPPSYRTMRRWHHNGRWLTPARGTPDNPAPRAGGPTNSGPAPPPPNARPRTARGPGASGEHPDGGRPDPGPPRSGNRRHPPRRAGDRTPDAPETRRSRPP